MVYQPHKRIYTPPDETTVYRYMSFWKFVYLLRFKKLYFVRLDRLEDEMEGIVDDDRLRDKDKEAYLRINKYVNCWHISEYESAAMWKLYGGIHSESIAIKSSVGHIKEAVNNDGEPVIIGRVDYEKKPDDEILKNFYVQVYYKRKMYAHEQELRLCVSGSNFNPPPILADPPPYIENGQKLSRLYVSEEHPKGKLVRVDLSKLIDTVVVGDSRLETLTKELVHSTEGLSCCPVTHALSRRSG